MDTTISMIEDTGSSLISSIVAAKMKLHRGASSFDSKEQVKGTREGG